MIGPATGQMLSGPFFHGVSARIRRVYQPRGRAVADTSLIGQTISLTVPVSEPYDQLNKGNINRATPESQRRLDDQAVGWFDELIAAGAISKPLNFALLTKTPRSPATMGERLVYHDILLDSETHKVFRGEKELKLGPTEVRLLTTFMEKPGRVWSRDQLLDRVWGRDIYVDTRTVDVHVGRLRKVLGSHGGEDLIRTMRGAEYALVRS